MAPTLETRVKAFLSVIPGAESIDALNVAALREPRRRADFLLHDRRVIVELKTLTIDTSHKIDTEIDKHREREEFPVFYGKADLRRVLARLPDGDRIYRRIYGAITRSVEGAVRSAEEQISQTRELLNLPGSVGLLILLNESVDLLSPDVVGHRVAALMRRPRTGRSNAPVLDFVWLLFESHLFELSGGASAFPSILIRGERATAFPWVDEFLLSLQGRWGAENHGMLIAGGNPKPGDLSFSSAAEVRQPPPTHISRQDLWAREYDANPHFRSLSDQDVLARGAQVLRQLVPYFLKGGPSGSRDVVEPLLREFGCFLQESNHRGLDMRDIPKP